MTRSDRSHLHDREGTGPARGSVPGSLPIRFVETVMRHPLASGGVAISLVTLSVIFGNALANQPARHPHPWFSTRAPEAALRSDAPARVESPAPSIPNALPRPRPTSAFDDPQRVQELQTALRDRGFYAGPIDGVLGPSTVEAVRAFERRLGIQPTGEPSELLIGALRTVPPVAAVQTAPLQANPTAAAHPARPAAAQAQPTRRPEPTARPAAAVNVPVPAQRLAAADAVGYPVAGSEADLVEVEAPQTTGSIRRPRDPLAPGGDERAQKIQQALLAAGYGPIKPNGVWDDRTTSAVRRYEADHGWPVTGRPSDNLVYGLLLDAAGRAGR